MSKGHNFNVFVRARSLTKFVVSRLFKLKLIPDNNVFSEDVTFESTKGPVHFDPRFVYTGTLEGKLQKKGC